jgi:hypothetical protein
MMGQNIQALLGLVKEYLDVVLRKYKLAFRSMDIDDSVVCIQYVEKGVGPRNNLIFGVILCD